MIRVEHLSHYYGALAALDDVSFEIEAGHIVGLLGLNGAGKSTMLKILSGILLPTSGHVSIDGVDVSLAPDDLRRRIGFLPDTPPLYPEMRVDEFLLWCGEMRGRTRAQAAADLPQVLETCQIAHVARTVIAELSHGYRKRVGIAQTLIHRPALVLLDEPISGLDPVQIVEMRQVVRSLKAHATVLISSHILSEVAHTCERLLVLDRGRLRAEGAVEDLVGEGSQRAEFQVRGGEQAVRAALTEAGAEDVELERAGDVCTALCSLPDVEAREVAVAALVQRGLGVQAVRLLRTELESLFVTQGGPEPDPAVDAGRGSV